jgi:hypothetical protein
MKFIHLSAMAMFATTISITHAAEKACTPIKHAKLPVVAETTYHKARKMLLSTGWQPLQTKSFNDAKNDPDISSGNGSIFWEKGYFEVEGCAGSGVAPCVFLFKDVYGNKLRVTTTGEEYPKEKIFAKVTGTQFVCE